MRRHNSCPNKPIQYTENLDKVNHSRQFDQDKKHVYAKKMNVDHIQFKKNNHLSLEMSLFLLTLILSPLVLCCLTNRKPDHKNNDTKHSSSSKHNDSTTEEHTEEQVSLRNVTETINHHSKNMFTLLPGAQAIKLPYRNELTDEYFSLAKEHNIDSKEFVKQIDVQIEKVRKKGQPGVPDFDYSQNSNDWKTRYTIELARKVAKNLVLEERIKDPCFFTTPKPKMLRIDEDIMKIAREEKINTKSLEKHIWTQIEKLRRKGEPGFLNYRTSTVQHDPKTRRTIEIAKKMAKRLLSEERLKRPDPVFYY